MNRFIYLAKTFENTGIGNSPVITDEELKEYLTLLKDLAEFMAYRNDSTMSYVFHLEHDSVHQMIMAREN